MIKETDGAATEKSKDLMIEADRAQLESIRMTDHGSAKYVAIDNPV